MKEEGWGREKSESLGGGENLHGSHVWLRRRAWRNLYYVIATALQG